MNAKKTILAIMSKGASVMFGFISLFFAAVFIDMLNEDIGGALVVLVITAAFAFISISLLRYSKKMGSAKEVASEDESPAVTKEEMVQKTEVFTQPVDAVFEYDALVIDFETATEQNDSACSIGLALLKGSEIVKTESYLIQPPNNEYRTANINIHSITPKDTENEPFFDEIWTKIKHYFQKSEYITAYNAQFDMSVLKCTLELYELADIDFEYFDAIPFSSKVCGGNNKKLNQRCETLGIELDNHHDALADTTATAKVIIKCMELKN